MKLVFAAKNLSSAASMIFRRWLRARWAEVGWAHQKAVRIMAWRNGCALRASSGIGSLVRANLEGPIAVISRCRLGVVHSNPMTGSIHLARSNVQDCCFCISAMMVSRCAPGCLPDRCQMRRNEQNAIHLRI
eukprot:IDg10022t1